MPEQVTSGPVSSNLIKGNQVTEDVWQIIAKDAEFDLANVNSSDFILLPLALWLACSEQARNKTNIGVWIDSDEAPEPLAEHCQTIPLIAINFPVFSDGRGYSYARTLRDYYGYEGELRAIGDVLRDQLYFYQRCGFNSYLLRADQDASQAIDGLNDFSVCYQAASDQSNPLLRRR